MKVFVVMIQDRHTDTECEVYEDSGKAISRALELAERYAHQPVKNTLNPDWVKAGCLAHFTYSCESDCTWVMGKEVK